MVRTLIYAIAAALPLPALAGELCVGNATSEPLLFAVDSRLTGERALRELGPDGQLCIKTPDLAAHGVVSVFTSLEAEEGCSRVVRGGGPETLIAYADFDRCEWSSHRNN